MDKYNYISSLDFIKNIIEAKKDDVFIIDSIKNKRISYIQLGNMSMALVKHFNFLNIKKGDKLAVILNNSSEFAIIYFACLFSGIVFIPINPALSIDQKEYIIEESCAKNIIVSNDTIKDFQNTNKVKSNFLFLDQPSGILKSNNSDNNSFQFGIEVDFFKSSPFLNIDISDIQLIIYTSGTTSLPKGVVHSYKNLINNAWSFINEVHINEENRFYNNLAMTYTAGNFNLLFLPFVAKASLVIGETFSAKSVLKFWDPIISNKVNTLWLVPTIASILNDFDRGEIGKKYCREHMKLMLIGTAPLPQNVRNKFQEKYGHRLIESYGLSETLLISTEKPTTDLVEDSVGEILPIFDVKILDDSENILEDGKVGEICIFSNFLMLYYTDNKTSKNKYYKKEFRTGDYGYVKNNILFISGRKKDLIIRGGINISPMVIENVLYENEAIKESAVIGVPHPQMGEEIVATVVLKKGYDFSLVESELKEECKTKLSDIYIPTKFIQFKEFPHSSSGKIQKTKIREQLLK